jgi:murein DD-endopeptidase MepM/ murein hydrolase activator NlpD
MRIQRNIPAGKKNTPSRHGKHAQAHRIDDKPRKPEFVRTRPLRRSAAGRRLCRQPQRGSIKQSRRALPYFEDLIPFPDKNCRTQFLSGIRIMRKHVVTTLIVFLAALAVVIAALERRAENVPPPELSSPPLPPSAPPSALEAPQPPLPSPAPSSDQDAPQPLVPPQARTGAPTETPPSRPADAEDAVPMKNTPEAEPETPSEAVAANPPEGENPAPAPGEGVAEAEEEARTEKEAEPEEDAGSATSPPADEDAKEVISGTVEQGDTAAKLLGDDVHGILQASRKYYSLANIRSGQPYLVVRDYDTKEFRRFEYEIDAQRKLVVENDGNAFSSRVEQIAYDIRLALLQGRVESNLFQSVAALGESPSLAIVVADVFRWDIDFIRDVQDGDSFGILVEKRFRGGQFKNYGRVLGATFTNKGKLFEAFLFRGVSGFESHYNQRGESLRKVLLKAPLAFTRITSGYSRGRRHPIFHDVRPHEGVDYGAPTGTPVKAVGDGVVVRRGWQGGYGNTIALRHGAGLESQYGHLSGFARGLTVGARVRQGQVIGFVGSTGWATGPHLDFRLKQNGRFINPTKAVNPREERIVPGSAAAFRERVARIRDYLSGNAALGEYEPGVFQ